VELPDHSFFVCFDHRREISVFDVKKSATPFFSFPLDDADEQCSIPFANELRRSRFPFSPVWLSGTIHVDSPPVVLDTGAL